MEERESKIDKNKKLSFWTKVNLDWSEKDHSDFLAECDCLFELGQIQELINNLQNHMESKDPDIQERIPRIKRSSYFDLEMNFILDG